MTTIPYNINKNETLGRYMVSSRTIKEGELILKENPLIIGPQISGALICFNCNSQCNISNNIPCPKCSTAIICSKFCSGKSHPEEECEILKSSPLKFKDFVENSQIIFVVRCILLRRYKKDLFKEFMKLESHMEQRRNTPIWRSHKVCVEQVLQTLGFLSEKDVESEIVLLICGILDVNSFELRPPKLLSGINPAFACLRGIYLQGALMAHDCVPNVHLSVDEDFLMTIHASKEIPEGETIFYNYANGLQGSYLRRKHLKEGKYFDCLCKRCSDPTEMGTHLSSIVCPKCKIGKVSPINSISDVYKTKWKCDNCQCEFIGALIKSTLNEVRRIIDDVSYYDVQKIEFLLRKLQLTLNPNHFLLMEVKQNLVALYNTMDLTRKTLERKIDLCREILRVLEVIEPGISRLQAITLYELHAAELNLCNKLYKNGEIEVDKFLERLQECEVILKEAVKFLLYEPTKSPEGRLGKKAMGELRTLKGTILELKRIVSFGDDNGIKNKPIEKRKKEKVRNRRNVK